MQLVKPTYQLMVGDTIAKKIERIARVCYKSEDLIGEGTAKKMISTLFARDHLAMLEHGDLCWELSSDIYMDMVDWHNEIRNHEGHDNDYPMFLRFSAVNGHFIISGNITAWIKELKAIAKELEVLPLFFPEAVEDALEQERGTIFGAEYENYRQKSDLEEGDLMYDWQEEFARLITDYSELSDAERIIHETLSVWFNSDRGFTHELVRMRRDTSFAQESTRYCNYSKGKFGSELAIVNPIGVGGIEWSDDAETVWQNTILAIEEGYMKLTELGIPAQIARGVLPQNVKAEITITATLSEWQHIFALRACDATGPAHPQMKEVMIPLCKDMQEKYPFAFGHLKVAEQ